MKMARKTYGLTSVAVDFAAQDSGLAHYSHDASVCWCDLFTGMRSPLTAATLND